jgi:hypothetical protein
MGLEQGHLLPCFTERAADFLQFAAQLFAFFTQALGFCFETGNLLALLGERGIGLLQLALQALAFPSQGRVRGGLLVLSQPRQMGNHQRRPFQNPIPADRAPCLGGVRKVPPHRRERQTAASVRALHGLSQ